MSASPGAGGNDLFPELQCSLLDIATDTHHRLATSGSLDKAVTADGLGLTVDVAGQIVFGGCNRFTRAIDELQYSLREGPCLEAQYGGVLVESTKVGTGEARWPVFTPRAAILELRSVVSVPLITTARVRGSLNIYGSTPELLSGVRSSTLEPLVDAVIQAMEEPVLLAVARANQLWFDQTLRDQTDIEAAAAVLTKLHALTDAEARTLIHQIALEDGTTDQDAARIVLAQERGSQR